MCEDPAERSVNGLARRSRYLSHLNHITRVALGELKVLHQSSQDGLAAIGSARLVFDPDDYSYLNLQDRKAIAYTRPGTASETEERAPWRY